MKIAFFTELPFTGKVQKDHPNMRTEFAWMYALDADHYCLSEMQALQKVAERDMYDLGVIIFPKTLTKELLLLQAGLVSNLKMFCSVVAFMQEGPSWYFQDLPVRESFWMCSQMAQCDLALAHNQKDRDYYAALLSIPCEINPTLMISESIPTLSSERKGVIIGGNLVRWYGGLNSVLVARAALGEEVPIWLPRMGRMHSDELYIEGLNHLPYMLWGDWIAALSKFKYAIHLNPNTIGGTFSLNCAYLGIPCISNKDTDTQRNCFPDLSVDPEDLETARDMLYTLHHNSEFYSHCANTAKENYNKLYSVEKFLEQWSKIKSLVRTIKLKNENKLSNTVQE